VKNVIDFILPQAHTAANHSQFSFGFIALYKRKKQKEICVKFLVLLLAMLGSMRASPTITVESPLPWLHISADPQAVSQVAAALPQAVLAYSVVITNNGTVPIAAIDVLFTVTTAGKAVRRNFLYNQFGEAQPVLPVGQSRVVTPFASATAIAAGTNRGGAAGSNDGQALTILTSADAIHIAIDLVVAADGRTAGPDVAKTIKKLTQQRDAYSAMRAECLARLTQGVPDAAIQAWLTTFSQQKIFRDPETNAGDRYASTQASLARQWLNALKAGKRTELANQLSTVESQFTAVDSLKGGLQ
jgi:hypothetical protein